MNNEKLDTLLNLALDATPAERARSAELNTGYDETERTWQVIAKSSDGFSALFGEVTAKQAVKEHTGEPETKDVSGADTDSGWAGLKVQPLLNGYGILTIPQSLIGEVAARPEIAYMELPKRLFFAVNNGRRASCVSALQSASGIAALPGNAPDGLFGNGILVAVIDSGIDYAHPDFCNGDGTTRIVALWDQTLGRVFDSAQINEALAQSSEMARYELVPSRDLSGHGTHVAGIACGNGRASDGVYRGVAPKAELLVVKLGNAEADGFPRTTELMTAVDYVLRKAEALGKPVAVNLSFGNNYGSHDGGSLLETYLDEASSYWKNVIVAGTGNEGDARIHTSVIFQSELQTIELAVGDYEPSLNLQLWKSYADRFEIRLRAPDGTLIGPLSDRQGTQRYAVTGTELLIYYGEPRPYSVRQEIYVDFLPTETYVASGVWEILLTPEKIVDGRVDFWLPGQTSLSAGTGFLTPAEDLTLTIPSTAARVISVGAYQAVFDTYAAFSGRGCEDGCSGTDAGTGGGRATGVCGMQKPDLAAPGVNITSCAPGGGYAMKSGTSMAAPFVTGAAALLMEWGIRLGNDPYLYGEKIKAYVQSGAAQLPGFAAGWNPLTGYGALCVRNSLPENVPG